MTLEAFVIGGLLLGGKEIKLNAFHARSTAGKELMKRQLKSLHSA